MFASDKFIARNSEKLKGNSWEEKEKVLKLVKRIFVISGMWLLIWIALIFLSIRFPINVFGIDRLISFIAVTLFIISSLILIVEKTEKLSRDKNKSD